MTIRVNALASFFLFCSLAASAQDSGSSTKTLAVDRPMGKDPIRITKVMEGDSEVKSDGHEFPNKYFWEATFQAGDDWLKGLTLSIKNESKKKIVYLEVSCNLFETPDWQTELAKHSRPDNPVLGQASNVVGWRPEHALYSMRLGHAVKPDTDKRPAFELAPGQEFTISIEDSLNYSTLQSEVEKRAPISNVTACSARVSTIFFDDGTMWQPHAYSRAADDAGSWRRITFEEWANPTGTQ
jgi:hypothetical protein